MKSAKSKLMLAAAAACLTFGPRAQAGLSFYVEPNNPWPAGWYDAAVANMQTVVNMYNAYGDFGNGSIYVYYNSGIPTAQSGYGGWGGSIGDGGTYPNVRVLLHESSHWLGTGTYSANWGGPNASALIQQFEGVGARLNGDGAHYWPYGENYDNESSPINDARHVAMVYALRKDFGIGSTAPASAAKNVNLTASDALGTSGFNYPWGWSDGHFPQAGTAYSTGNYTLRTPASGNSFNFAGDSLVVNNTNGLNGGLIFKGTGTTAVTTFRQLTVNGGYVRHANGPGDLFQLAGNVTLTSTATFDAAQGDIRILANVGGTGSLNKVGPHVLTLSGAGTYGGNTTINGGTLRLEPVNPVASYTFDNVSGGSVVNAGTGGTGMNGALANGASIVAGGHAGNAVNLANGASVDINSPVTDLGNAANWTVSAWVKTATAGSTILSKSDGGWSGGNTIFYLGDGSAGGSGGIPSAVRWGGGFLQGAPGGASVLNNLWHQVTYVNNAGDYAIYVDGVAQPLSPGNAGFATPDVGSIVRLGVTTDTVAGDGTVNFKGLLDDVRLYGRALSPDQVTALYGGTTSFGPLPSTTNVTIASSGVLDVNGANQQIGSLAGPVGATVTLGTGRLTVNSAATTAFSGTIAGAGGSLVKTGAGTFTLAGNNAYTGPTTVGAGTLRVSGSVAASGGVNVNGVGATFEAAAPQVVKTLTVSAGQARVNDPFGVTKFALTVGDGSALASPLNITGGTLDLTTNGLIVRSAAGHETATLGSVRDQVITGYAAGNWQGNGITSSTAAADASNAVGYALAGEVAPTGAFLGTTGVAPGSVVARLTLSGDATLDGSVDFNDLVALAQNYNSTVSATTQSWWTHGDFTYDGVVDFNDMVKLAQNYNAAMPSQPILGAGATFEADLARAFAAVPDPGALPTLLSLAALSTLKRRRRHRPRIV
jgi:autotransporter-associated beta strand protein